MNRMKMVSIELVCMKNYYYTILEKQNYNQ